MKRSNFIVLFAVLVGSLCLVSCFKDDDEKNGFFYSEPEVEIQSYSIGGLGTCFFSCKVWPTKEMYDDKQSDYQCGLEYSSDSLFRSSTKIVFGLPHVRLPLSGDYITTGRVGDLFPDSTYYFRALLILVDKLTEEGQSFSGDRFGNTYVNKYTHIIKDGKTVSITMPHSDVNEYVHASVTELGTMNLNIEIECDAVGMTDARIYSYDCSLEFSEDSTFSDNVKVMPFTYYASENKFEFKYLKPSCDYYYRIHLYYKDKSVSYYGDVIKVSTLALKTVNGTPYVDLGLSVMWAYYNVGAHSPLEPGGFYCWGETEELTLQGTKVTDYFSNNIEYSKYNETDGLTVLQPLDDVATVKWGAPWHIPDEHDIVELYDNCTKRELTIDGQKVVQFTSKINGNYIIIPMAGWYSCGRYLDWDHAWFWTRTLSGYRNACSVRSDAGLLLTSNLRSDCLNVRPVVKP